MSHDEIEQRPPFVPTLKSQQVASNVSHAANFDKAQSSNHNDMSLDNKLNDLDMKHYGSVHVYNPTQT